MSPSPEDCRAPRSDARRPLPVLMTLARVLTLLFTLPLFAQADDTIAILFVSNQTTSHYLRFIDEAKQALRANRNLHVNATSMSANQLRSDGMAGTGRHYDMVVILGSQAARALQQWQPESPVLYTLIPRPTYKSLEASGKLACPESQCSAIYIDQPLPRLFRVLDSAFRTKRELGVLLGPVSVAQHEQLVELAATAGFSLHTAKISEQHELLPALNNLLKQSELLLSLPDPLVYNRRTAKGILLTTYRHRVPVVAYSKAYADAGATLSVYSTPEQIARQTARVIIDFFTDGKSALPEPQYPAHFRIRVNEHVADSLNLDFDTNPELRSIIEGVNDE